jgi:hypothetical protein
MCTACGPFGPWVQAGSRRDFPGSLKGRPQHRSLRACRRHEHTRQLPPHGKSQSGALFIPARRPSTRDSFFISGTSKTSARTERLWATRSESRWPSFSTRLWSPARRSPSRVRLTSTPRGQPSHGMRTVSTARSRDAPAMHRHGTTGSRAAPVTLYRPGRQSQTHWSGAVRRIGILVQSPLGHILSGVDLRLQNPTSCERLQSRRSRTWGFKSLSECSD